jgi:hypothetical protein
MTIQRKKRNKLLTKQNDCCNLCGHHFSRGLQNCYDEATDTLLCRNCLMLLTFLRVAVTKGMDLVKAANYDMDNRVPA